MDIFEALRYVIAGSARDAAASLLRDPWLLLEFCGRVVRKH